MEIHTVTRTPTNKHMHPSHLGTLISPIMKYVLRYAIQCCVSDAAVLKHRVLVLSVSSRCTAVCCTRVKWTGSESFSFFFQWLLCSSMVPICQEQKSRTLTLPRCLLSVSFLLLHSIKTQNEFCSHLWEAIRPGQPYPHIASCLCCGLTAYSWQAASEDFTVRENMKWRRRGCSLFFNHLGLSVNHFWVAFLF